MRIRRATEHRRIISAQAQALQSLQSEQVGECVIYAAAKWIVIEKSRELLMVWSSQSEDNMVQDAVQSGLSLSD